MCGAQLWAVGQSKPSMAGLSQAGLCSLPGHSFGPSQAIKPWLYILELVFCTSHLVYAHVRSATSICAWHDMSITRALPEDQDVEDGHACPPSHWLKIMHSPNMLNRKDHSIIYRCPHIGYFWVLFGRQSVGGMVLTLTWYARVGLDSPNNDGNIQFFTLHLWIVNVTIHSVQQFSWTLNWMWHSVQKAFGLCSNTVWMHLDASKSWPSAPTAHPDMLVTWDPQKQWILPWCAFVPQQHIRGEENSYHGGIPPLHGRLSYTVSIPSHRGVVLVAGQLVRRALPTLVMGKVGEWEHM